VAGQGPAWVNGVHSITCRNRHCPKCQGSAALLLLAQCPVDLLPVPHFHVVFSLPAPIAAICYTNKAVVYGLLFEIAPQTLRTIAADPKHLGARNGAILVPHTWGSALTLVDGDLGGSGHAS